MTARVQSLRSSVTGARPTGRLPGELYVNFVDKQLGVVDAANVAQDLIAVRFFSPTANYSRGDMVVNQGRLWSAVTAITAGAWNPAQWDDPVQASDRLYGTTAFEPTLDFVQGELVVYNSRIWKAKTAIAPGAWNAANWELLTPPVGVVAWALTDSYAANALVSYQGKIYRAKAAVASGTWNAADWEDIAPIYVLPIATAAAIGGVKATAKVARKFFDGVDANGDFTSSEIPAATATNVGGIKTVATPPAGQFINGFATDGTAQYATPAGGIPPHDATKAYAQNDLMSLDGVIYRAPAAIPAGAFNVNLWEAYALLRTAQNWTRAQTSAVQALTYAASVMWALPNAQKASLALTGNATISAVGAKSGGSYWLFVTPTASETLSFNAGGFDFGTAGAPTLSGGGKTDILMFECRADNGKLMFIGKAGGFA